MYDSNVSASADDMERVPCFTLATALVLLGHDCPGGCPRIATGCRAAMWCVRLGESTRPTWTQTLVDVEFVKVPWQLTQNRDLIAAINECVRPNHLRVRMRTTVERATLVAALADRSRARALASVG